jgi:hypothetical protein
VICQRCRRGEATHGVKIFNIVGSGTDARHDQRRSELCDECSAAFTMWLNAPGQFIQQLVQSGVPLHQAAAQAEQRFPVRTIDEFLGQAP